ncbi:Phage capsid scaffolding protein (GPO) serine peptidase [compost metagenome]
MNKAKQKIYTSIEIDDSFADTGEAYIVGLAVTDSPASLGTDVLAFSAQKPDASPFKDRHYSATSMFTEAVEVELSFDEIEDKPSLGAALFTKVQELLKGKQAADDGEFAQIGQAVQTIAEHVKDLSEQFGKTDPLVTQLSSQVKTLQTELADLKTKLGNTADHSQQQRPEVTGGAGHHLTQY